MIQYLVGDVLIQATTPTVIIHICNNINKMGAGFVVPLYTKYPTVKQEYHKWFADINAVEKAVLGNVQFLTVGNEIYVANMIAQEGVGIRNGKIPLRYDALETCLKKVNEFAISNKVSVSAPRLGCGLAGGRWSRVEEVILSTITVPIFVYTLPSDESDYAY